MADLNIIDVFAVYGDYGNIGNGRLIGFFDDNKMAELAAKNRGSLDCGGDGQVIKRKGIKNGNDVYLIESFSPINSVIIPPRTELEPYWYSVMVTDIIDSLKFMFVLRRVTGMSLLGCKQFVNDFRSKGKLELKHPITSEQFKRLKSELNLIAVIEAIPD